MEMSAKSSKAPRSRFVVGGRAPLPIRVPADDKAKIERLAEAKGISVTEWVCRAIDRALKQDRA